VRAALQRAELVIVQEAYRNTITADYADVLLPATTWGEKEGTVTNSERRITRVRAALPAPGEARHDWRIVVEVARRLESLLGRERSLFPYEDPEAIWNEHRESTRGRDLDITGLSWRVLEERGPQQWPYREGARAGRKRLYEDGVFPTATGRARFVEAVHEAVAEPTDARYPFRLNTGRLRDQWHGMSRTGTVARLYAHAPEPAVAMSAADMQRHGLRPGDLVHVTSRRGSQILPAQPSEDMKSGQVFIGMHWGEEFLSGRGHGGAGSHGVNALTLPALDPYSFQPELKHAAVKILKADLPWRFLVFGWVEASRALALQAALRPAMRRFAYASCTLFGRERVGVLLRAADDYAADAQLLRDIEVRFGIDGAQVLRYDDARRGIARHLRVADGRLAAVALAGDIAAEAWLRDYLENEQPVASLGRMLLSPSAQAPQGMKSRGRIVCNCLNVAASEIDAALEAMPACEPQQALAALQRDLRCGTSCGSCVPELKQIVMRMGNRAKAA
jgi:assimilatory nitrate reductase catalytic subunit